MQYAHILYTCTILYMLTATVVLANPNKDTLLNREKKAVTPSSLPASCTPSEISTLPVDKAKENSPTPVTDTATTEESLVKSAHKNAMELLDVLFIPKAIPVSIYKPFLQNMGIKLNWGGLVWGLIQEAYYEGGMDFHCRGNIDLTIDVGYARHYEKHKQTNTIKYDPTKGWYVLGGIQYIMHPNAITNAYAGIGYGKSYFTLLPSDPSSKSPHWARLILGSECRLFKLIPTLYGGMQMSVAYLLRGHTNQKDKTKSHYVIPGYGKSILQVNLNVACYIKWNITFLERKEI